MSRVLCSVIVATVVLQLASAISFKNSPQVIVTGIEISSPSLVSSGDGSYTAVWLEGPGKVLFSTSSDFVSWEAPKPIPFSVKMDDITSVGLQYCQNTSEVLLFGTTETSVFIAKNGADGWSNVSSSIDIGSKFIISGGITEIDSVFLVPLISSTKDVATIAVFSKKSSKETVTVTLYPSIPSRSGNNWVSQSIINEAKKIVVYIVATNGGVFRTEAQKDFKWSGLHVVDFANTSVVAVGMVSSETVLISATKTNAIQVSIVNDSLATIDQEKLIQLPNGMVASSLVVTSSQNSFMMSLVACESKNETKACALHAEYFSSSKDTGSPNKKISSAVAITITFTIIGAVVVILAVLFARGFLKHRADKEETTQLL